MIGKEVILLAFVGVIAFSAAFYFFSSTQANERAVNGIRVYGADKPVPAIASIVSRDKVLLEQHLFQGNDSKNSLIAIQTAQIINVFRTLGKKALSYGIVEGVQKIGCTQESGNCTGAQVIIKIGGCNCMRVENQRVIVEGTEEFYSENKYANVMKIAGIFGAALLQEANS